VNALLCVESRGLPTIHGSSVIYNQASGGPAKERCYTRLLGFAQFRKVHQLSAAQAHYFSEWYIPAVRELAARADFRADALTLASYVFGRYGPSETPREDGSSLTPLQWEQLVAFVEDHLGDSLSLPHLASLVGYSADHFARLFKRAFRLSPHQYILERRVERAKSMLRTRSHSIAEVAVICGFASQAHLHAAFRARTGLTPGAFRRS
jgi:AraC-like DNA-binding protein